MKSMNEDFYKSLLTAPEFVANYTMNESAWIGHIPFGAWLVKQLKPKNFVELGTHYGHSYFAICQAIQEADLNTKCFAIDLWEGDEHSRSYGNDVFQTVENYSTEHYRSFSNLLKMTFDDALSHFDEGSIDLLHIDGLHTYEAVKHDYETWLPKLAPGAVILFHDTSVKENNFGVYRLWDELTKVHPQHFNFDHSFGLGVVRLSGGDPIGSLNWLGGNYDVSMMLNNFFSACGVKEKSRHELIRINNDLMSLLKGQNEHIRLQDQSVNELRHQIDFLEEKNQAILRSFSWRITAPFRLVKNFIRK
jgi:hypothetical protein